METLKNNLSWPPLTRGMRPTRRRWQKRAVMVLRCRAASAVSGRTRNHGPDDLAPPLDRSAVLARYIDRRRNGGGLDGVDGAIAGYDGAAGGRTRSGGTPASVSRTAMMSFSDLPETIPLSIPEESWFSVILRGGSNAGRRSVSRMATYVR